MYGQGVTSKPDYSSGTTLTCPTSPVWFSQWKSNVPKEEEDAGMKPAAEAEEMSLHRSLVKSEQKNAFIVMRCRLVHNQNLQPDDWVVCILSALH